MKSRLSFLTLLSLLIAPCGADAQQAGRPVRLVASLQAPVSNPFYGVSMARFKEEVEKRSNKTLVIDIHDNAKLARDDEVVGAVSSGKVDIGITATHQYAKKVPAIAFVDQPFLLNFPALVRAAVSPGSEIRNLIDDTILAESGMRILWWQSLGDTVFYSRGRDYAEPERFKGQRVGVPGRPMAVLSARCGAVPSTVPVEQMNDALKAGSIDAVTVGLAAIFSRELWKGSDTITRTAHAALEFLLAINEKSFQSLSPAHRTIVIEAARAVERETRDRLAEFETKAIGFARSKGMRVVDLTPDQVAEWRACSADMIAEYMSKNGELARRLMAAYGRLRTDPCCSAGPNVSVAFTRR